MSAHHGSVPAERATFDDQRVMGLLGWATVRHLRACAILVLVALAGFLPGLAGIAPVDRDEARFVQATRQMLETGDFVDIRLQDEPRYKKPAGIYWLQAATVTLSGHGADAPIWAYRLASVLGALAAVLLTYWAALPLFGRPAGLLAGLAMAATLLLAVEAHLAKTDAVLLATVVLAEGVLARAYLGRSESRLPLSTALLFWVALGLGILVKGPIVVMVAGLTALALVVVDRRAGWLRQLRPLAGLPLTLLIVLPWFLAILSVAGTSFFGASVGNDLLGKVASGQESHWGPPGYHLLLLFVLFLPAIMLLPSAIGPAWALRRQAAVKFCLAWLLPSWLVFELVATKLPHYTLPLYPAIALLFAGLAADGRLVTGRWWTRGAGILPALLIAGLATGSVVLLARLEGIVSVAALVLALAALVLAVAGARQTWRDQPLAGAMMMGGAALAAYAAIFGLVLPEARSFHLSPRIAEAVAAHGGCASPALYATGYDEPSLVFATHTDIRLGDPRGAADFLGGDGCRLALVEAGKEAAFLTRAAKRGIAVEKRATVEGMSLGHLERLSVGLWRARPDGSGQEGG